MAIFYVANSVRNEPQNRGARLPGLPGTAETMELGMQTRRQEFASLFGVGPAFFPGKSTLEKPILFMAHDGSMVLLYMVTFTINIPQMLAYIPASWILWVGKSMFR